MTATATDHVETTATMVRLYVFLAQYLDRCVNESARATYPEEQLQTHLAATRGQLLDILSVNPVVKAKVAEECNRILTLGTSCLKGEGNKAAALESLSTEREILRNKTIALSDLLAVFRAQ
ncbi:hypothetical protein YTPLAS18_23310 [Nitrospira sp.]|nr:hypothetical protein YTPLAS18_23310 [Nitrospira sp.]